MFPRVDLDGSSSCFCENWVKLVKLDGLDTCRFKWSLVRVFKKLGEKWIGVQLISKNCEIRESNVVRSSAIYCVCVKVCFLRSLFVGGGVVGMRKEVELKTGDLFLIDVVYIFVCVVCVFINKKSLLKTNFFVSCKPKNQ